MKVEEKGPTAVVGSGGTAGGCTRAAAGRFQRITGISGMGRPSTVKGGGVGVVILPRTGGPGRFVDAGSGVVGLRRRVTRTPTWGTASKPPSPVEA
jgi:hypothetical protein